MSQEQSAGNALISVYEKRGIVDFAGGLINEGQTVYASGGTATRLTEADLEVKNVSELVGGEAILGHRVVTLSREVFAGILADKTEPKDIAELEALGIPLIDLVAVDMYPLEEEIAKPGATRKQVIAQTDIGGPTMLRAAAKGLRIVLSSADQREEVLEWIHAGMPNEQEFREKLAARAEYEVSRYVATSANYLNGTNIVNFAAKKHASVKYGENPQQAEAAIYADNRVNVDPLGIDQFRHVQGMEQSYVNTTDIDRLLQTTTHIAAGFERNFGEVPPIAVGVKHGNACGAGVADTLNEAVQKMLEGDTRAIFGGVVMLNGVIDKEVAETLMRYNMDSDTNRILDGVVAADVTEEALALLTRNKLRVVVNAALGTLTEASLDSSPRLRQIRGGFLRQPNYDFVMDLSADYMDQYGEITDGQKRDLVFAWAIGCTSNSNTITLVKNGRLIGNGVGQQDRIGAGQLALSRTTIIPPTLKKIGRKLVMTIELDGGKLEGAVAYSDSFFPFEDGPLLLAEAGIKVILTSSGSLADSRVFKALTSAGVSVLAVPDKIGRGFYAH